MGLKMVVFVMVVTVFIMRQDGDDSVTGGDYAYGDVCKGCVLKLEQSNGYKEIEQRLRVRAKSTRTLVANSSVLDMSTTMVCAYMYMLL